MSYLSAADEAALRVTLATKTAQLTAANTTYTALLGKEINEYNFSSGEGSQRAKRIQLKEIRAEIEALEADIARINRRLNSSGGLVNITLRRQ